MNRLLRLLVAAIGCCTGCLKPDLLTPEQFTRDFAKSLQQSQTGLGVEIVKDLELKIKSADGRSSTSFLDNAYDLYKQNPKAKSEVIQRYVSSSLESINNVREGVDRSRIVPVIKDRPWLEETREALLGRGVKKIPGHVYEDFSPELIVLYAEDSPKSIHYLAPSDLELAKIDRAELRKLACDNLNRLLPKIEYHGTSGLYMITAGGDYEASLLLLDSIWSGGKMEVEGDFVVAVPTRDLLLVTGSRNPQGIEKVKQMVKEASTKGAYRLTQKLFVYRNGRFGEFKEDTKVGGVSNSGHLVPLDRNPTSP